MAKCETCEANKQGVTITKEIVDGLMETVRNLYSLGNGLFGRKR